MENSQKSGKAYKPVNDDFYDELEAAATLRQNCEITFVDDEGKSQEVIAQIKDLYVDEGAEYARLDNHQAVRLDQITYLNGKKAMSQPHA
jgi:Rho-binding antiterminator